MSSQAKKLQNETESSPRLSTKGIKIDPELKAQLYQIASEIEPFLTEETHISIVARDPAKLAVQLEVDGNVVPLKKLKKMHRVAIILKENGTQVESEHLGNSVVDAITGAKDKLLAHLHAVQDEVITVQDRIQLINAINAKEQIH
jgi:hypothetical protein